MTSKVDTTAAAAAGQKLAARVLARRNRDAPRQIQSAATLLAVGDSWFDYPLYDVLKKLADEHSYHVLSSARAGQSLESMASDGGQIDRLARLFEAALAAGRRPKAILISGGGDDIAGQEFGMLLNSASLPAPGWNAQVVSGVIDERIATAYRTFIAAVEAIAQHYLNKPLPVVIHGYDYPVPDGRGLLGGHWPMPGPWLQPGFLEKQFTDLALNVTLMHALIDRFNDMLAALAADPVFSGTVHYLDLRGTLSTELAHDAYRAWWGNELHPTELGFSAVANKFALELSRL